MFIPLLSDELSANTIGLWSKERPLAGSIAAARKDECLFAGIIRGAVDVVVRSFFLFWSARATLRKGAQRTKCSHRGLRVESIRANPRARRARRKLD